jgi:hypothetical protein
VHIHNALKEFEVPNKFAELEAFFDSLEDTSINHMEGKIGASDDRIVSEGKAKKFWVRPDGNCAIRAVMQIGFLAGIYSVPGRQKEKFLDGLAYVINRHAVTVRPKYFAKFLEKTPSETEINILIHDFTELANDINPTISLRTFLTEYFPSARKPISDSDHRMYFLVACIRADIMEFLKERYPQEYARAVEEKWFELDAWMDVITEPILQYFIERFGLRVHGYVVEAVSTKHAVDHVDQTSKYALTGDTPDLLQVRINFHAGHYEGVIAKADLTKALATQFSGMQEPPPSVPESDSGEALPPPSVPESDSDDAAAVHADDDASEVGDDEMLVHPADAEPISEAPAPVSSPPVVRAALPPGRISPMAKPQPPAMPPSLVAQLEAIEDRRIGLVEIVAGLIDDFHIFEDAKAEGADLKKLRRTLSTVKSAKSLKSLRSDSEFTMASDISAWEPKEVLKAQLAIVINTITRFNAFVIDAKAQCKRLLRDTLTLEEQTGSSKLTEHFARQLEEKVKQINENLLQVHLLAQWIKLQHEENNQKAEAERFDLGKLDEDSIRVEPSFAADYIASLKALLGTPVPTKQEKLRAAIPNLQPAIDALTSSIDKFETRPKPDAVVLQSINEAKITLMGCIANMVMSINSDQDISAEGKKIVLDILGLCNDSLNPGTMLAINTAQSKAYKLLRSFDKQIKADQILIAKDKLNAHKAVKMQRCHDAANIYGLHLNYVLTLLEDINMLHSKLDARTQAASEAAAKVAKATAAAEAAETRRAAKGARATRPVRGVVPADTAAEDSVAVLKDTLVQASRSLKTLDPKSVKKLKAGSIPVIIEAVAMQTTNVQRKTRAKLQENLSLSSTQDKRLADFHTMLEMVKMVFLSGDVTADQVTQLFDSIREIQKHTDQGECIFNCKFDLVLALQDKFDPNNIAEFQDHGIVFMQLVKAMFADVAEDFNDVAVAPNVEVLKQSLDITEQAILANLRLVVPKQAPKAVVSAPVNSDVTYEDFSRVLMEHGEEKAVTLYGGSPDETTCFAQQQADAVHIYADYNGKDDEDDEIPIHSKIMTIAKSTPAVQPADAEFKSLAKAEVVDLDQVKTAAICFVQSMLEMAIANPLPKGQKYEIVISNYNNANQAEELLRAYCYVFMHNNRNAATANALSNIEFVLSDKDGVQDVRSSTRTAVQNILMRKTVVDSLTPDELHFLRQRFGLENRNRTLRGLAAAAASFKRQSPRVDDVSGVPPHASFKNPKSGRRRR